MKIRNLKVKVTALSLLATSVITLSGCKDDTELAPTENYDTLVPEENGE